MLDVKWVRAQPQALDEMLIRRGGTAVSSELLALDSERRAVMTELQHLQSERNRLSKEIGKAKATGADASALFTEMQAVGPKMKALEEQERALSEKFSDFVATLPNILADDVPDGADDSDNVEVSRWGTPPEFPFEPQHHADLGEALGGFDFTTAGVISGSRFAWVQGGIARLERALATFMLDQQHQNGFTEVNVPLMVTPKSMYGTGQLPKFGDDAFTTNDDRDLMLIPTSEVPLTNYMQDRLIKENELPLKFTAHSSCFRKEAGSAGRDTRGYIRMHQFNKVEMVQIVHPDHSWQALEDMRGFAEGILQALKLPYRVVNLCSGDIGFGAMKTYDLEVWLPAQNTYREISSVSNCGDFQARRMNGRFKGEAGNQFVHTLNGSGLAVGRTLVAVMENYQQADGSIQIPDVLQPYLGGQQRIQKAD